MRKLPRPLRREAAFRRPAPLYGMYLEKPTIAGVPYGSWDANALDEWLADPFRINPRTGMAYKIPEPESRRLAIEALKILRPQ